MAANSTSLPGPGPAGWSRSRPEAGLSIVVPVYNEEGGLRALHERICGVARGLKETRRLAAEVIYVDDGSRDDTRGIALSLPADFVYRDGVTKAVLRDAVRNVVPASALDRRDKVGFEPPQAAWLAEPAWVTRVTDVLLDPGARARSLYRADVIELDARAARWRDPGAIWRALNLELWLRAFERPGCSAR